MANGKAISKSDEKEWMMYKAQVTEVVHVFGGLLFSPIILLVGIGYGLRAGIVVCLEKTLEMLKGWGE
jgi:hypothetical protein